jgi:hypothetical protein
MHGVKEGMEESLDPERRFVWVSSFAQMTLQGSFVIAFEKDFIVTPEGKNYFRSQFISVYFSLRTLPDNTLLFVDIRPANQKDIGSLYICYGKVKDATRFLLKREIGN